jgi:restriction system protein
MEARRYLLNRWSEARHTISPALMEEVVVSVLRSMGYEARATGRSGDGGIDAVLESSTDAVAVQVKRTRRSIEVEQLRAFVGALVIGGRTRGVFVTTSQFRSGVPAAAKALDGTGYAVELVDGERFLAALDLAQRQMYASQEELLGSIRTVAPILIERDQSFYDY